MKRMHRILVEVQVEAPNKVSAEANFKDTQWDSSVKVVDILYVKSCKKEKSDVQV